MGSKAWMPGLRGFALEPVGGGQDPGGVGGSVACGQAQLDGLAGGIEADQVHPGRCTRPDGHDLEVVGARQPWMGGRDATGEVAGRAGWTVPLRPAVPFEQVRIERLERSEQVHGGLDQPAEQHDADAEVGGHHGCRPVLVEQGLDPGKIRAPAGRGDDEAPTAALQARDEVRDDRLGP